MKQLFTFSQVLAVHTVNGENILFSHDFYIIGSSWGPS